MYKPFKLKALPDSFMPAPNHPLPSAAAGDTTAPTAAVAVANPLLLAGSTSLVTITFDEVVYDFTNADLTVANGTLSSLQTSDWITFTATLTPTANVESGINVITLNMAGVQDESGNPGVGLTTSNYYTIDTRPPTVSVVVADNNLRADETSLVTFTFSEVVLGFGNANLNVGHGSLSAVASQDWITWTAILTPSPNTDVLGNVVSVNLVGVTDSEGNSGSGSVNSNTYRVNTLPVDRTPPTATVVVSATALRANQSALVTVTFSEAVTDVLRGDLTVANGVVSNFVAVGDRTFTATVTPKPDIEAAVNVMAFDMTGATDAANNHGLGSITSNTFSIDSRRPTITSIVVADTQLRPGETSLVTFTFSEPVTGLTAADITVGSGSLSEFTFTAQTPNIFTATLTPSADTESVNASIGVDMQGIQDLAGNAGTGSASSNAYSTDTKGPALLSLVVTDTDLRLGESTAVTFIFSEPVNDFVSQLVVGNGSFVSTGVSGDFTFWSGTFTPTNGVTAPSNVISLNLAHVTDKNGLAGVGTATSVPYSVDTARPTVTSFVVADDSLIAGETSLVTVVFSEPVTGLSGASWSLTHATLDNLASSDGITWTMNLTPAIDATSSSNTIGLNWSGVADLNGNGGLAAASSNAYSTDTLRPGVASIVVADNHLRAGETSLVTITFSEAVTGFSHADLSSTNSTLGPVSTTDSVVWTATLTPVAGASLTSNVLRLNLAGVIDLQGNSGSGSAESNAYTVPAADADSTAPTFSAATVNGMQLVLSYADANQLDAQSAPDAADFAVTADTVVNLFGPTPVAVTEVVVDAVARTVTLTLARPVVYTDSVLLSYTDPTGSDDAHAIQDTEGNDAASLVRNLVTNQTPSPLSRMTASFVLPDTVLGPGETTTIRVLFSEPLPPSALISISADNALVGSLQRVSDVEFTVLLTPPLNMTEDSNQVHVFVSELQPGRGFVERNFASDNYEVRTTNTAAILALNDLALNGAETATVTLTFSAPVAAVSAAGLSATNAVLSDLTQTSPTTWTATLTPNPNVTSAGDVVRLDYSSVTQAQGGQGFGTVNSAPFSTDTTAPTVAIGSFKSQLQDGDEALVFFNFSEAPVGFTLADTAALGGSVSGLASTSDPLVYKATFKLAPGSLPGDRTVLEVIGAYDDAAGNPGRGASLSFDHIAKRVAVLLPAASVPADDTGNVDRSANVVLHFSERLSPDSYLGAVSLIESATGLVVPATKRIDDSGFLVIDPLADLALDTEYVVTWPANGPSDVFGNAVAAQSAGGANRFNFRSSGQTEQSLDGVLVESLLYTDRGVRNELLEVQPVPADRQDDPSSGHQELADIVLARAADGAASVSVSLPIGIGLRAGGTVESDTDAARHFQGQGMAASSGDFSFDDAVTLLNAVRKVEAFESEVTSFRAVALTVAPDVSSPPASPLVIRGQAGDAHLHREILVVDASALPYGTVLNFDDVEVVFVVGAVRVGGGKGNNLFIGDGAVQFIVQGAGDDELHGGGGDDVVASRGGNDLLFGDEGNDWVVGGGDDDTLQGGDGDDVLQGGQSDAGRWTFQIDPLGRLLSAYETREDALSDVARYSHLGAWSGAGQPRDSDDRLAYSYHDPARLETIALLSQLGQGRLPTLNELNAAADGGGTEAQLAEAALNAYKLANPAWAGASLTSQVRSLLEMAWGAGPAADAMVPIGVNAMAGGVTWVQAFVYLAHNEQTVRHFSDESGTVVLAQFDSPELGWLVGSGNDQLHGGAGNDRLVGGRGSDVHDGGEGLDTAVFTGNVADFRLSKAASGSGAEWLLHNVFSGDTEALNSIERLEIGSQAYVWSSSALASLGAADELGLAGFVVELTGLDLMDLMGAPPPGG